MKQSLSIWLDAARPKTLPLALVSIVTGSSLAFSYGRFSWLVMLFALTTATLLQILSNLANDYGDAIKGTDNEKRLGPMRAIQSGQVNTKEMKLAIIINLVLTVLSGLGLVFYALTTLESIVIFIILGLLSTIAAITYTVGKKAYGYMGFGDLAVFLFFGLLGVSGTFFLHTGTLTCLLLLPACGCGLIAVAVLNINNMRDIDNDRDSGKCTIAVRLGRTLAKQYHLFLLIGSFSVFSLYLVFDTFNNRFWWISLLFTLSLIPLSKHAIALWNARQPSEVAPMLPEIVKCSLFINLLFSLVVIAYTFVN